MTRAMTKPIAPPPWLLEAIQERLQTVYDPEFPVIDIYTLWLIYDIDIQPDESMIHITMTFTTPACPMGDMIEQMVQNAIIEVAPAYMVTITVTFDPSRWPHMIKDEDLQRMFE
jgi:metal-sulfur cluster biosynthetic enzyme